MKAILWLPLFFAPYAYADDAADRAAIGRVIATLNETSNQRSHHPAIFTPDGNAASQLERLRKANLMKVRIVGPLADPASLPRTDHATVTISHEPWGEATINLPGSLTVVPSIVFITPDLALAEGVCTYRQADTTTPLLFLMKKEGDDWKIASLWVLGVY